MGNSGYSRLAAIQQLGHRRGRAFLPFQGRFQTVLHKTLAHIGHRITVAAEQLRYLPIFSNRASHIDIQENMGMLDLIGGSRLAFAHQGFQIRPFLRS
jgi:hypothetical protein